jgi:hypothetical protein
MIQLVSASFEGKQTRGFSYSQYQVLGLNKITDVGNK